MFSTTLTHTPSTGTALLITLGVLIVVIAVALVVRGRKAPLIYVTARSAPSPNDLTSPHRVSPGMTQTKFWELVEHSWGAGATTLRHELHNPKTATRAAKELTNMSEFMLMSLHESLFLLSQEDLTEFENILNQKMAELDNPETHEYFTKDPQEFTAACAFVVASGQAVYQAVLTDPSVWTGQLTLQEFTKIPAKVMKQRFGPSA